MHVLPQLTKQRMIIWVCPHWCLPARPLAQICLSCLVNALWWSITGDPPMGFQQDDMFGATFTEDNIWSQSGLKDVLREF